MRNFLNELMLQVGYKEVHTMSADHIVYGMKLDEDLYREIEFSLFTGKVRVYIGKKTYDKTVLTEKELKTVNVIKDLLILSGGRIDPIE